MRQLNMSIRISICKLNGDNLKGHRGGRGAPSDTRGFEEICMLAKRCERTGTELFPMVLSLLRLTVENVDGKGHQRKEPPCTVEDRLYESNKRAAIWSEYRHIHVYAF